MPAFTVLPATTPETIARCFAVRREVFVVGQRVPEEEDFDGLDEACAHLLALDGDGQAVGAARLRITEAGEPKAERVAVRLAWRGQGVGKALMGALEVLARQGGHPRLVLNAQLAVIPFYEALGYRALGPVFYEADIPHRHMERDL